MRIRRTRKSLIAGLSDCTSHLILESASESGNSFPYFFDLIHSRVFPGSKPLNKRVGVLSYLITVKINEFFRSSQFQKQPAKLNICSRKIREYSELKMSILPKNFIDQNMLCILKLNAVALFLWKPRDVYPHSKDFRELCLFLLVKLPPT